MKNTQVITSAMERIQGILRTSLEERGHVLTGSLRDNILFDVKETPSSVSARMTVPDYGMVVEFGVRPERIPYTPGGPKRGGTSKYIQGLIDYFEKRGRDSKEAKQAAFATARVHSREGMSTKASARFSSVGKRNAYFTSKREEIEQILQEAASEYGSQIVDVTFALEDRQTQTIRL
jgi:hypothetical protein